MFRTMSQYRQFEDQLANMWGLIFPDYPNLDFHLVETTIPFSQLVTETRKSGKKYYSDYTPTDSVSFTFRETELFSSFNFFQKWLESIYDYEKGVFKVFTSERQKYKNAIIQFSSKFAGTTGIIPTKSFELIGLLPLGFSEISLSNDTGEPLQFTVNMTVEKVKPL